MANLVAAAAVPIVVSLMDESNAREREEFQQNQMLFNVKIGQQYSEISTGLDTLKNDTQRQHSSLQGNVEKFARDQDNFKRAAIDEYSKTQSELAEMKKKNQMAMEKIQGLNISINSLDSDFASAKEGITNQVGTMQRTIGTFKDDQNQFNQTSIKKQDTLAMQLSALGKMNQMLEFGVGRLDSRTGALQTALETSKEDMESQISTMTEGLMNCVGQQKTINKGIVEDYANLKLNVDQAHNNFKQKQVDLKSDIHSETKKLQKKLDNQNRIFYYLIASVVVATAIFGYLLLKQS